MVFRKLNTDELNRISAEETKRSAPKIPVTIVLDNVRSLNNIGSVFRTCDALGATQIVLCGISGTPPHREIHRTALGAEDSVEWRYFKEVEDALKWLRDEGYTLHAIEQTTNSVDLRDFSPTVDSKNAFIFGNEIKGVSEVALELCDNAIEIPQFGSKHSFNVSVSAGIVLWDTFTKVGNKQQ